MAAEVRNILVKVGKNRRKLITYDLKIETSAKHFFGLLAVSRIAILFSNQKTVIYDTRY